MLGRNKKATRKGRASAKKKQNLKSASGASVKKAVKSTRKTSTAFSKKSAPKGAKTAVKKRPAATVKTPKSKARPKIKASAGPSGRKASPVAVPKSQAKKTAAKKDGSTASKSLSTRASAKKGTRTKNRTSAATKAATIKTSGKKVQKKISAKKSPSKKPRESSLKVSTKISAPKRPARKTSLIKRKRTGHAPPIKPPFEAYNGIRSYLFTSYAHEDMKAVFSIIKKLYKKRYRIWYDEGIEPGNEWPEIVGKAIVNCTQFLVLMSPHAAVSRNVRNEINLAFTENKNILVVFIKETSLTEGMKLQIGTMQFINKYELSEREFLEKLDKVIDSRMKN